MTTLAAVLDEMADTIRSAVATVTDVDVQVEPRMVLNPTPPCIDMYPGDPSADQDTGGFGEELGGELITVRVRVDTADHEAGQDLLLAFMDLEDELSIVTALTDDPTLNGLGQIDVQGRSGFALFPVPAGDGVLLGCTFSTIVIRALS